MRAELWLGRGRPSEQILALGHLDAVHDHGILDQSRRSEPSRRWLLRLPRCPFELLNRPAKPIENGFLNRRCVARLPEARHRISALVQRNIMARDRFAALRSRNEIDEPAL